MAATCPICNKAIQPRQSNPAFPFCCKRCKMVDLGNWFGESYVVSRPIDPENDAEVLVSALEENQENIH